MNYLIITPRIPYPPFRGDKLKIYNIAKILSTDNKVTILTFYRNQKEKGDLPKLAELGISVEAVKLSYFKSFLNLFTCLFSNKPFQVAYYSSAKMDDKINQLTKLKRYDVIYFHLIRTAQYYNSIYDKNALKVIDYTDSISLYLNRFYEIEKNIFKKYFIWIEKERIAEYEKIARNFDTLFICSSLDKMDLNNKGINNIRLLPNGVDINYFTTSPKTFDPKRIIFTGHLPYFPNYDAIFHFVKDIFPMVLTKIPDAFFYIVGQHPPRSIQKLAGKNIKVTGFVEDIKAEYLKSAVNIAPMRFGAGTLNKIIESIALGVPVVASEMSVSGMHEDLKKYVLVAANDYEFSQKIIYVINNPSIRTDLMEEGKEALKKLLSWNNIVSDFEQYLKNRLNYTLS